MSQKTLIDKQTILLQIKDVMFSSALALGAMLAVDAIILYKSVFCHALTRFSTGEHLSLLLCMSLQRGDAILFSCLLSASSRLNEISERATLSIM